MTVIDHNDQDSLALNGKRINSGSTLDISVEIAGNGFANVGWITVDASDVNTTGGKGEEEIQENGQLIVDLIQH
ncbi:hypothetical protein [Mesorhizobium sp. 1B3]|uniref:hypothetical protein n=1 Tax=Mesorhizobium sp. 1B3 TaxID=3243599 RepID=UPI003D965D62